MKSLVEVLNVNETQIDHNKIAAELEELFAWNSLGLPQKKAFTEMFKSGGEFDKILDELISFTGPKIPEKSRKEILIRKKKILPALEDYFKYVLMHDEEGDYDL